MNAWKESQQQSFNSVSPIHFGNTKSLADILRNIPLFFSSILSQAVYEEFQTFCVSVP